MYCLAIDTLLICFRFPFKRPAVFKQWIKAVRRDNWMPTSYSFICSEHFLSSDYQLRPGAAKKLLKDCAVPSIFKFPDHLIKKDNPRRILKRPEIENKVSIMYL